MTLREFYLQRRTAEHPAFMRVLQALPADQAGYKPNERSPAAQQIVWTMANELQTCIDAVKTNRGQWIMDPAPSLPEMVSLFEQRSNELTELVAGMDEPGWERTAQFFFNGKLASEQPIGAFLWFIHFDAIHHRGQLTVYLRPMGAKVPAVYGPSADERPSR